MAKTTDQGLREQHSSGSGPQHVLVAYASRHGSTKGVAERVAVGLGQRGLHVEVRSVGPDLDVGAYDAVVFGSAVFNQRWMPAGEEFVRGNLDALAARPVWLFSVGTFGDDKRFIGPLMRREPKGIGGIEQAIRPRDYRVFAGLIDRHQWPWFSRLFFHALGGRLGDNRNWASIDAWIESIAHAMGRA